MSINLSYTHTQAIPDTTWTVLHGLNCRPVLSVLVINDQSVLEQIIPSDIQHPDLMHSIITFTRPYAGEARAI